MQVHYTNVEMYRDTTDRRNIQKKTGAMPEKNGRSDQPFTKQNKKRKRKGQRWKKSPTMRYVTHLDTFDQPTNTNTGVEMMRKKQGERRGKGSMNSDGKQDEQKVRRRSNDAKYGNGISD